MKDDVPITLASRTKAYALAIIQLYAQLPHSVEAQVLGKQLLRSGTSVGAHYREGVRARSDAELVSKLQGALQELDESGYWLELLIEGGIGDANSIPAHQRETNELIAILTTCVKKVKLRISDHSTK